MQAHGLVAMLAGRMTDQESRSPISSFGELRLLGLALLPELRHFLAGDGPTENISAALTRRF